MTTKLSERLRELRILLLASTYASEGACIVSVDQCIAQAEAQEKLAFFEARVKPSSDDPDAQAGELSDEEFSKINQAYDEGREWNDFERSMFSAALRYARDHGYLRPSQAIGEPVTMIHNDYDCSVACSKCGADGGFSMYDDLEWAKFCPGCGGPISEQVDAKGNRTPHPLYRSPISPEARDKVFEAGSKLRNEVEGRARIEAFMSTQMDLSQNERENHEIRSKRMIRRIEAWDQALSALRK